jgi:hypothetical protein
MRYVPALLKIARKLPSAFDLVLTRGAPSVSLIITVASETALPEPSRTTPSRVMAVCAGGASCCEGIVRDTHAEIAGRHVGIAQIASVAMTALRKKMLSV